MAKHKIREELRKARDLKNERARNRKLRNKMAVHSKHRAISMSKEEVLEDARIKQPDLQL